MADKPDVKLLSKSDSAYAERRVERRLLCSNLVQVTWSGVRGVRRNEIGVLENLSRNGLGLCIYIGTPFERGMVMTIRANPGVEFTGCVVQCLSRENGYLVGLELDQPYERAGSFVPEHLVDVMLLELD